MFATMDDGTNHAMFNQITYNSPLVPAIFSELSLGPNATVEGAYGPLSFVVNHLEVFDIVLKNGDVGKHPLYVSPCHSHSRLTSIQQPYPRSQTHDREPCSRLYIQ